MDGLRTGLLSYVDAPADVLTLAVSLAAEGLTMPAGAEAEAEFRLVRRHAGFAWKLAGPPSCSPEVSS